MERQKASGFHITGGHSARSIEQEVVGKRERIRFRVGRMVLPKRGICGPHCGKGNITESSGTKDSGPHRRFQRNRPGDRPCENKIALNAQPTGPTATSGRRQSGVGRKTDLRRDLHVAERLIAVGTTPHEASTRNVKKMAQSALLSMHNRRKCWQKQSGQV